MPIKKTKTKIKKAKISVSKKLNGSVVARKALKVNKKPAITETQKKRETLKRGKLSLEVFDIKGKVVGSLDLPKEIFGAEVNDKLLAQAVRVYLANQREGSARTKTRSTVHGTTKKAWQQKGTGRARHGSRKAPIFVHGGIAWGPRPRDFSLSLSKKMRRAALFSALSLKQKSNEIKGIKGLEKLTPKTKLIVEVLNNLGVNQDNKKILLITPKGKEFENVYRAARNIQGVSLLPADIINAYQIMDNKLILLMDKSLDVITSNFLKEKA